MLANNSKNNKVQNRNIILKMLVLHAPISRIELSRTTGLSKMSLTNIISEFDENGWVEEIGIDESSLGKRKPVLLGLNERCICAIGINLTRDYVEGCLADIKGNLIYSKRFYLSETDDKESVEGYMIELVKAILNIGDYNIVGIGISSFGPINLKNGSIVNPTGFNNIGSFNVSEVIKRNFSLPVFVQKNNNSAILAEKYYGVAKNDKTFCYLGISRGVGASAVVDGNLITGTSGSCCEIGHITINYKGELCQCGNRGCLEQYANIKRCTDYVKKNEKNLEKVDFIKVVNLAKEGNKSAEKAIDDLCEYTAIGVSNLVKIYDPSKIVIGSDIATGGEFILNKIKEKTKKFVNFNEIYISKFFDKGPLIGAATLVFEESYFGGK